MSRVEDVPRNVNQDSTTTLCPILSPIDGHTIDNVPHAREAEIGSAFADAESAQREWAEYPLARRRDVLLQVARLIEDQIEEIAQLETLNTGKVLSDTRREARRAVECFRYYAGWVDKYFGETIPTDSNFHTYTVREPVGIVVGIIPWNVPFFFAAKKFATALAFGNACIVKPALETPLTALRLVGILVEAGVPDGAAQVMCGDGKTGALLTADPRPGLIVFTGHHETGIKVASAAAQNLVPTILELGGKSPQIVFADADTDAALNAVVRGIFGGTGQACIAGSRLLVEESIRSDFMSRLAQRVAEIRVGDPRLQETTMGPQVTRDQQAKTERMIQHGLDEGARVLAQGVLPSDPRLAGGYYVRPTVLSDVQPGMAVMQEEIFGPVLAATGFSDEVEAQRLAADSRFGLAAGVWTSDLGRAHRMVRALPVGTVWVNSYRMLADAVPFGGVRLSGYGREGGSEAAAAYTRTKSVWISAESGAPPVKP